MTKLIAQMNICGYICFVDYIYIHVCIYIMYKMESVIYHVMYNLFKNVVQKEIAAIWIVNV